MKADLAVCSELRTISWMEREILCLFHTWLETGISVLQNSVKQIKQCVLLPPKKSNVVGDLRTRRKWKGGSFCNLSPLWFNQQF